MDGWGTQNPDLGRADTEIPQWVKNILMLDFLIYYIPSWIPYDKVEIPIRGNQAGLPLAYLIRIPCGFLAAPANLPLYGVLQMYIRDLRVGIHISKPSELLLRDLR